MNVLEVRACKRVHNKLSCTRLQNYTIGASLLGIRIQIPKSNIPLVSTTTTGPELDVVIVDDKRHEVPHTVRTLSGVQQDPTLLHRAERHLDPDLSKSVLQTTQLQVGLTRK